MTTNWTDWIDSYFTRYQSAAFDKAVYSQLMQFRDLAVGVRERGGKMILVGNGASAAIAAHCSVDFSKQAGVRSINFNEGALLTCLSNDYGYENWVARAIELYGDSKDAVVLISSSGRSPNIVNGANYAKEQGMPVVTFTGHAADNPLKQLGDINFWLDSRAYNIVECTHMIWMTTVVDMLVGDAEYTVG